MPKRKAPEQGPGSGNVFADLGLPDADEHLVNAGLVIRIGRIIRGRGLTQAAAAKSFRHAVGPIPRLLGRTTASLSVALGRDVEIVVKPGKRAAAQLCIA